MLHYWYVVNWSGTVRAISDAGAVVLTEMGLNLDQYFF